MRVAYYSPLPPERSGIADYSALLLPALRRRVEVEVVARGRTRPVRTADVALYHVGNDPDTHGWIVDALRRRPGVVVLHEFVLHHLVAGLTIGRRDGPSYLEAMERDAGVPGRLLAHGVLEGRVPPLWEVRPEEFPLAGEVLDRALALIVHSRYVEDRAREWGYEGPIRRIPHPAWPVPEGAAARIEGRPLFGAFGNLNPTKRAPQLLEAFSRVRDLHPAARLLLVGAASPGFDVSRLGPWDGVLREDYVDEERLWALMAACDACISLRAPTMGETSGSAIRALSLGKPLVANDVGWFAELPDEVALKVGVDDDEVETIASALELLASSEAVRRTMSGAAREYVERVHDLDGVAEEYVAALEEAGGGGAVEEAVVREVAEAAADVGLEQTRELSQRLAEAGLARERRRPALEPPPEPSRRPRLLGLPVWAWLAGLVVASAAIRVQLSRQTVAPWIMVDEVIYGEMARSFAATGHFLIRGHDAHYGIVYPALIAPAFRAFAGLPDAYAAAKAIGAVVMSLAAVPGYLLARRVLEPVWALAAAVLVVAIPSMVYTSTLMTETAFYPIFVGVALLLVLVLERPTAPRQVALLVLCGMAFATRAQAVAFLPAIATAPLLFAVAERRPLRSLRAYRLLYGILAAGVLGVLAVQFARGRSPFGVFGAYAATGHAHYDVAASARWLLYHVAELDLYVGVVPLAATIVLALSLRRVDGPLRAFMATTIALAVWLVLQVSVFASLPSVSRIEERNLFYLAPLFLIALLAWIDRGLPRPARPATIAALVAAALPGLIPYASSIGVPAESDTLALLPLWYLQEHVFSSSFTTAFVVLCALSLALAFLYVSPRIALVLPLAVLAWFALAQQPIMSFEHGFRNASAGALFQGNKMFERDWIDRAVGRDATVPVVWTGKSSPFTVWENEFFNRSVGPVYALVPGHATTLPEEKASIDRRTGEIRSNGRPVRARYAFTDDSLELDGSRLLHDRVLRTSLWRTSGVLRTTTQVEGLYRGDTWSGPSMRYTRLDCRGGILELVVQSDRFVFERPQTLTIRSGGYAATRKIPIVGPQHVAVPLAPRGGRCSALFTVSPTAVPAEVRSDTTDTRRLGLHFYGFVYVPPK